MKAGPKLTYDKNQFDDIIDAVIKAKGSLGQVADLNKIARYNFYHWIRLGDADMEKGICSDVAQLSSNIRYMQAQVVIGLCETALENSKKSKFIMWWLGKICREDFGEEGIEMKELRDIFKMMLPFMGKGELNEISNEVSEERFATQNCS